VQRFLVVPSDEAIVDSSRLSFDIPGKISTSDTRGEEKPHGV